MDELSRELGLDPIEFRLRNASVEGTRKVEGPVFQKIGLVECLKRPPTTTTTALRWMAPTAGAASPPVSG